jgi:hypothetical protein
MLWVYKFVRAVYNSIHCNVKPTEKNIQTGINTENF